MTQAALRMATYEDLMAVPEHLVAEIIHGSLVTHPRPAPRHARASSCIGMQVGGPFDMGKGGPGGWWILDEPELHLGPQVLVPDLAGWRRERMPALPDTAWFELVPDWVCEVLSPATRTIDRRDKMPLYARHGVSWLWLIDPDARLLEAYACQQGAWTLLTTLAGDDPVRVAPFDAVEFSLGALWG
jgi:Uma2 family endonuclease